MALKRRFYRANLPTIMWNSKTNSVLAEFVGGKFTTENKEVADILIKEGYPEIALDTENPPEFEVPKGEIRNEDIPVLPLKYDEQAALNKQKAQLALEKLHKESSPEAIIKEEKPLARRRLTKREK